jgi:enolase
MAEVALPERRHRGTACAPSGASTGSREALELRDGDMAALSRQGRDRRPSATSTAPCAMRLTGMGCSGRSATIDQAMLDLDGTDNKESLGANAILAVSLAAARAAASACGQAAVCAYRRTLRARPA